MEKQPLKQKIYSGFHIGVSGATSYGGRTFSYSFPPGCVFCGSPTEKTIEIELKEEVNSVSHLATVNAPYCEKHIAATQKLKRIKRIIYFVTYIITVVIFAFLLKGSENVIGWAIFLGTFVWGLIVFNLLNIGLIDPLMGFFDKERAFDCKTNTVGFTARIIKGELYFYFLDSKSAERVANANSNNPHITQGADFSGL
jgi:hypothetical protein